jgi:transposase-like protein
MAATKRTTTTPPELKKQIFERIKKEGIPVPEIAKEHGIHPGTIYSWMAKGVEAPPSILELARLKKENQMLLELIGKITVELTAEKKRRLVSDAVMQKRPNS